MSTEHRLATYGTLAPGRPNHHHLSDLAGAWRVGKVRGTLVQKGWGAALGYPALVLGGGDEIEVHLFESVELPDHWARLDDFEGAEYRRVRVQVEMEDGSAEAWIYIDAEPGS
jgi:gamma-glutamylcyclotransferase (GGCT)/AIG2-like uncharacterized protein YtfP